MKKKKFLILSFMIPFLIYFIVFFINGFFTDKMIITGDSAAQYYPLFHYLKGIFEGSNSIFFSLSKGLGGTMFGTFFYYLSSPLNLLLIFIDKTYILDFITILTILKLGLCGLTMYIYMSKHFKTQNNMILLFSILYAFIGYNLNYFLNIMWLDVVLLTPIVFLGIDRIIDKKSPLLYILFLTISIMANYYITYMLCIGSVIYFIYEMCLKYTRKDKAIIKKTTITFLISSLLSGLMCAFFLIPCIIEMLDYGRSVALKDIFTFDYNIFNIMASSYIASIDIFHPFNTYAINLYCGIITLPLVFFYLKNKNISKKEKIVASILIIIFILPCFIEPLNYIWHLFSTPIGYSYRYSFLLCFFLLRVAYQSITKLNMKKSDILSYLAVYISYSVIFLFIMYFKNYYSFLNYKLIWLTVFILISYLLVLSKISHVKLRNNILFVMVLIECSLNISILLSSDEFLSREQNPYKKEYQEIYDQYKKNGRINTSIEPIESDYNTALVYDYSGTDIFLSTVNNNPIFQQYKMGYQLDPKEYIGVNMFSMNNNISYILSSLLGVHTIITDEEINYPLLETKNNLNIYQNETALSLGYIIPDACNLNFAFPYDEKILNCLTKEENHYYKEIMPQDNTSYNIDSTYYYIYLKDIEKYYEDFSKLLGDSLKYSTQDYILVKNNHQALNLESLKSQIPIEDIKIYYFDIDLFKEKINLLKKEQLEYTIQNNALNGTINTQGGLLLITIPYEKGIEVSVDNKKIKPELALNAFIGINLEEGEHTIHISYHQPGLKLGCISSILSFLLIVFYLYKRKK